MVEQDARLSVKDIASCTGISEGSVQTILKKRLDLRKVCARWVPHLLTEELKTQRLKCARELLKTYKGCNSRVISNLLTGDETWVHMFEPQRRADNKQWKRKDQKRPCIAKRKRCTQFSLIQVGQSFKCLIHLVIRSLADSTRILYWRKWKSFTIRNDQAKDGQEFTFYMTMPPLISVRLLSLFWLDLTWVPVTSFYFQGLRKCFLEISKWLEVLLQRYLWVSPTDTKRRLFICFSRLGKKGYKNVFQYRGNTLKVCNKICLIKRSTEVIRTQLQNFLQDPRKTW